MWSMMMGGWMRVVASDLLQMQCINQSVYFGITYLYPLHMENYCVFYCNKTQEFEKCKTLAVKITLDKWPLKAQTMYLWSRKC